MSDSISHLSGRAAKYSLPTTGNTEFKDYLGIAGLLKTLSVLCL